MSILHINSSEISLKLAVTYDKVRRIIPNLKTP